MNREEALATAEKGRYKGTYGQGDMYHSEVEDIIDEIFDDFNKRTCENCKYLTIEHMTINTTIGTCKKGIYDKQFCQSEDYIVGSFGCNKFESKG